MATRHAGRAVGSAKAMAVIGIGTTSRVTVEDVLAVIEAARTRLRKAGNGEDEKAPSLCLSPLGDRERLNLARSGNSLSPRGEGWGEGGLISLLAALDRPAINPVLDEAAIQAGLELVLLPLDRLQAAAPFCATRSEKSMAQYGIPSVAEAAALAAAGAGARLLVPRICGRNTTASVAA